jgi:Xaa-Pro aminopeptidase
MIYIHLPERGYMTYDPKEVLTLAPSDAEMQRRWKVVRAQMAEKKIDVLIIRGQDQFLGGYVQWFTDYPARNCYPMTVIFPLADEMTSFTSGGKAPSDPGPPEWALRGVKYRRTAPYFPSIHFTGTYDAELAASTLTAWKTGTIGIVNPLHMNTVFHDYLMKALPEARFVDATDLVDHIKAIKSEEEISFLMNTVALQDAAIEYARTIIKPGRRVFEIVADVIRKVTELGSEEQLVLGGCGPLGTPCPIQQRHYQNRMVQQGDQFSLMIEVNGPGGIYGEMGRCFYLGDTVPSELYDANELCKETQRHTVDLLKPGADPKEIWNRNNEFLISKGQLPETRLFAHGQGYDLVERPIIRYDEPMKLASNMNITIHPMIASMRLWVSLWDNFLISESGQEAQRLHKTPQEIFSL